MKSAVRAVKPESHRVRQHRGISARQRRLPLPTRLLLGLSVLALAGAVFLTATGGIGPVVSTLGAGFASALGKLIATPVPTTSVVVATDAPVITAPDSAYTNQDTVDLRITVPAAVVGDSSAKIRLYLALQGLSPAPIQDVPIGSTVTVTVPVQLTIGQNDLSATIVRSGVESPVSSVVTIYFDQTPPKITIKSPRNGSTVSDPNLLLKGVTEPGTTIVARNDANSTSVTVTAASDGSFQLTLILQAGTNAIHLDSTDLAGNESTTDLSYVQGSGNMHASLSASLYRISISHHPGSLQMTVLVTDPSGVPLVGASASFTLQIPGLAPISGTSTTGTDGRAQFTTPLVGTLQLGNGNGVVLVSDPVYGQATDHVALSFVK